MRITRRAALAALAAPATARAQQPTTRLIVPFAPGGAIDAIGRFYAAALAPALHEAWVVENRTGGNGVIGARAVAAAAPDGRMLMFNADAHIVAQAVMRAPGYDPVADFTPVARVAEGPLVLVGNAALAPRDLPGLIAAIRARQEAFSFANSSLGALGHLATEWFKTEIGARDVTVVSYRGTNPALTDVLTGQPGLMMAPMLAALPHVRSGRLRAYALAATTRSAVAPEIPTGAEQGLPGLDFVVWYGMWGPRGLPAPVVQRLNAAAQAAGREEAMVRRLAELGCVPLLEGPDAFAAVIARDQARNFAIIRAAGIEPE
jgi:tripartite-type tricarboxylate transporter receptor subunit TctC